MTFKEFMELFNNSNNENDFIAKLKDKKEPINDEEGAIRFFNKIKKNNKNTPTPSKSNSSSSGNVIGDFAGGLDDILSKFQTKSLYGSPDENTGNISDILEKIKEGGISWNTVLSTIKLSMSAIVDQIAKESDLQTNINESLGITGKLSEDTRDAIIQSSVHAKEFGYGLEDVARLSKNISESTGKFNMLSDQQMNKAEETARAFVGDLGDLGRTFNEFEKVGIGATKAMDDINNAGLTSLQLGLRSKTTVKDISENLGKLNEYGFKNGIQGLAEMSRKASEFRINMSEVFKVADKVLSPEGAIDLAANLQVLGGAIGDFNDPLKLMYDATNNVEGLQDALIKSASSLATYNQEQGRFEITGVNLRRAREMANQLGVSMGELTKSAIASQERMEGMAEMSTKAFGNIKEEDKRFLLNMSRMDKGEMKITIPPNLREQLELKGGETEFALKDLSEKQANAILEYKKQFEGMDTEAIAKGQFSEIVKIRQSLDKIIYSQITKGSKAVMGSGENQLGFNDRLKKISTTLGDTSKYVEKNVNLPETAIGEVNKIVSQFQSTDIYKDILKLEDWSKKNGEEIIDAIKNGMKDSASVVKEIFSNITQNTKGTIINNYYGSTNDNNPQSFTNK